MSAGMRGEWMKGPGGDAAPHELSAALQALPVAERAQLAVELIDAELESGAVEVLGNEEFHSGRTRLL